MINFIVFDFMILLRRKRKAIIWHRIVATPMPVIPIAGIGPKPKINNGFNIMLRKKLNTNTFLNVFVSPSACNKELRATTEMKIIEPENITSV